MKVTVIIFQILVVAFFSSVLVAGESNATNNRDEEIRIVQQAIKEATIKHDEKIQLATVNGAQSPRREPKKSSEYSREVGRISNIYRDAYQNLISSNKMKSETALSHLKEALPQVCQLPAMTCDPDALYRTNNGSCNNLKNPRWGAAGMPNTRILLPVYENSFDGPRGGLDGTGLPPPRDVTLNVHTGGGSTFIPNVTHIAAQFGQFLDHDISLTPVEALGCCQNGGQSPDCWRINVKPDDPFYRGRANCLDFVRSTAYCFPTAARREQMNAITAFIDGSGVYGSDDQLVNTLRKKEGGKLIENSQYPGFLPWRSDVGLPENGAKRVIAGDVRADEMPGLATLQALFLREHNRLAEEIGKLQSNWTDEVIFQETRRILAAELQQITYSEFLPAVVGHHRMAQLGLKLPDNFEEHTVYHENVDATIFNSFATAAYRFGHTLVNGLIELYLGNQAVDFYNVRENYLNVDKIVAVGTHGKSGFHLILNGLIRQRAQAFDAEIHEDMTNYLFADVSTMIGHDLAARNIQRGRDHGIPAYNEFRKRCNLPSLTSNWAEKPAEINMPSWTKLQSVYSSPLDIDLYTGGLSEDPAEGALAGPTFICLQAIQFEKIMKGDRFFFTHQNQTGSFTTEQLVALRKRTFGDIICQNSDLEETARNVFYVYSNTNPMISCKDVSREMDLSLFVPKESSASTFYLTFTILITGILCSITSHFIV